MDLVSCRCGIVVTLPGGAEHVFQFWPTPASYTTDGYGSPGLNLTYSFNALGEGTQYVYTTATTYPTLPAGLMVETWRVSGGETLEDSDPGTNPTRLSSTADVTNVYYETTNVPLGAVAGKLEYTQEASGRKTYFQYDAMGNVTRSFYLWDNPDSAAADRWVVNTSFYDGAGRVTSTSQAVYADDGDGVLDLSTSSVDANGNRLITETVYQAALTTGQTHYDDAGQVDYTTDQYGGETHNTHNAKGQLIRTVYPDGTETRTVYDAMGRVEWTMERFVPVDADNLANSADTAVLSHTIYDSLGRVVTTERYSGGSIYIEDDVFDEVTLQKSVLNDAGTPISSSSTVYDEAGRVVETVNADGLRSGTVYYSDGRVHYAGVLEDAAASDWFTDENPLTSFQFYTTF